MLRTIRAFWHDQRGIALILVSVTLPAIIGFSLLAIDMSRVNNLHNDLQKGADALALATAAELDGGSDSITRGDHALATLVANQYNFTTTPGPQALAAAGVTRRYLKSLPATDNLPIADANVIANEVTDAKLARFVEVKVTPVGFAAIFPASFLSSGASNSFTVGAVAVAGFDSSVCDYTPVFICNPYEQMERDRIVTLEEAAASQDWRRKQILMRMNGSYEPGNFAFLESPAGNGAPGLEAALASTKPPGCYDRDGVTTEPGQNAGPVKDGLNSRFGIAKQYFGSATSGPAKNVRMGLTSINCSSGQVNFQTNPALGVGLNEDSCFANGTTCPNMSGRMGAGDWSPTQYWVANHPPDTSLPNGLTNNSTRYEVYQYENKNNRINDVSKGGERGGPACGATPVTTVDRRLLYGAIIDCLAVADSGAKFSGKIPNVPVRAFASFFITEPIKNTKDIYGELVDITGKGGRGTLDNFLRDEVQLYR
ncbi:pilus assembly protein TadG-related protein [Mesorhizobium sp. M0618]|uniref:TadE/TadG family type IV pilus assembly protein n=1 Tax=unclassified Mesorhizobium TaxID=325217 RepID=UPI00333606AD